MAIKTDVLGMVHEYHDYFIVGREKVREYANAVKSYDPATHDEAAAAALGHAALVAPLTFVSTFALVMQQDFFRKVDTGFETMQIVQVDQRFKYYKPLLAGDKVFGRMEVISVDQRFGADIVVTRNTAADENGDLYLEAFTTLMGHEGDNSISLKYDLETGQVTRTAAVAPKPDAEPAAESEVLSANGEAKLD
jgi:acyl dehydratase